MSNSETVGTEINLETLDNNTLISSLIQKMSDMDDKNSAIFGQIETNFNNINTVLSDSKSGMNKVRFDKLSKIDQLKYKQKQDIESINNDEANATAELQAQLDDIKSIYADKRKTIRETYKPLLDAEYDNHIDNKMQKYEAAGEAIGSTIGVGVKPILSIFSGIIKKCSK